jgi:hypothetical protein
MTAKQIASHRSGYCAQHYHLISLDWINPRTRRMQSTRFEDLDAQFFVAGKHSAQIVVNRHHRIAQGLISQAAVLGLDPVRLAAITYTITACGSPRSKKIVSEDFIHKFKRPVALKGWKITSGNGPLWTWRPLNDLLTCRCFGTVSGAQFVA